MNITYITLLILTLVLMGCGGGGSESSETQVTAVTVEESSDDNAGSEENQSDETDTSQSNPVESAAELQIDKTFNLSTDMSVTLDVLLTNLQETAFLNVCQYDEVQQRTLYNHCLYKGKVDNRPFQHKLMLSHSDTQLVAEVWVYQSGVQPTRSFWQYQHNTDDQQFSIRD